MSAFQHNAHCFLA